MAGGGGVVMVVGGVMYTLHMPLSVRLPFCFEFMVFLGGQLFSSVCLPVYLSIFRVL